MHMPKTFLAVGAVTLGLMAGSAVAKDTDTEAQLREALRQKMAELSAQPAEQAPQATPAKPAATPAPAKPAPTPAVKPAPVIPAAPAAAPVAAPAVAAEANPLTAAVAQDDPEAVKMREALHERMAQEAANPTPAVEVAPAPAVPKAKEAKTTPAPVVTKATKPAVTGYAPLVAPALPLSGTKEQRLQQLLEQYKADQITPAEYHAQRAKIIAE